MDKVNKSTDLHYVYLRVQRNRERDRQEKEHIRGSVKYLDIELEAYERIIGTIEAEKIYLENKHLYE